MKIVPIFVQQNKREGLFSIHLDNEQEDEVTKCIEQWLLNSEYLNDFFTLHQDDLNSGYYEKVISISEAINYTRIEAEYLFTKLERLAISGTNRGNDNLSTAFMPLRDLDYIQKPLQQVKSKTKIQKRWLRIYAIKIGPNTFIVTGGAIKLVGTMNERPHLLKEKQKLDDIKYYLKEEGILDQDNFEVYEI
ncbi:hypothetical protein [Flavobacterium sp.]|uniref:hypothetical protein n=1 Tax=Flavobacterium sp. TaxID=239 RepID=UPI00374DDD8A